jgi:hypothetical protein
MSVARLSRESKRQLGQFLTPRGMASGLTTDLVVGRHDRVLEPGFGDGSFIVPLIKKFLPLHSGTVAERLGRVLTENVFGVELDKTMFRRCLDRIATEIGPIPQTHNLLRSDFLDTLRWPEPPRDGRFTHVVGNPPFGGSFDPVLEDEYDRLYGSRGGQKIKKETYAFFTVKATELLEDRGELVFLCSDSLLSINTMRGLRDWLLRRGAVIVERIHAFSDETDQDVVILKVQLGRPTSLRVFGVQLAPAEVALTPNHSWLVTSETAKYFNGPQIGSFMVATGGMTTGKNEHFVRPIRDGRLVEPYEFSLQDRPFSLEAARQRARLGNLPASAERAIRERMAKGEQERFLRLLPRGTPIEVTLPNADYRYYNKATSTLLYAPPTHAIYWRNEGEAVLTYKRTGNWYLRGVGGAKYFGREGITWSLVSSRLWVRWLPPGYILDSGAPAAFLRPGIPEEELFFVLGWTATKAASGLLKGVINHTRNIQGKDFERLPYPYWIESDRKSEIAGRVRSLVDRGIKGEVFSPDHSEIQWLESAFRFSERMATGVGVQVEAPESRMAQMSVWTET